MSMFIDNLCFEDRYESIVREFIQKISTYSNIYCFGAGGLCKHSLSEFKRFGFDLSKITCIFDNNPLKNGTTIDGIEVTTNILQKYAPSSIVIITTIHSEDVRETLSKSNVDLIVTPAYINGNDVGKRGLEFISFVKQHTAELEYIYNQLADDKSKKVWIGMINYRMTSDISFLSPYIDNVKDQYFDPLIELTSKEVFLDAGAYDGDTIRSYIKHAGDNYSKIIAYETDPKYYQIIVDSFTNNEKIVCMNKGVYSCNTILKFLPSSTGGHLSEEGTIKIPVCTIDSSVSDKTTYIKMDIEGTEYDALLGAQVHIKMDLPKLAICIYHEFIDLIRIPLLILSMDSCYKLYIRHYKRDFPIETVCYAIPQKQ